MARIPFDSMAYLHNSNATDRKKRVRRKGLPGIDNRYGRIVRGILDMVGLEVSMTSQI